MSDVVNLNADLFLANQESEINVLGSFFLESELIGDSKLRPQHFYSIRHRLLYELLQNMDSKKLPIEIGVVCEEAKASGNLENMGGISYIMEVAMSVPSAASFDYHQGLVLEYYRKRQAYEVFKRGMQEAQSLPANELLQKAVQTLQNLDENDDDDDGHISKVLVKTYEWMNQEHGEITGATTGFPAVDEMTNGLQRQDLVILGGRPSMGKTAVAVQMCMSHARTNGPTAIFSLEMKNQALALRMISNAGNIRGQAMQNPMKNFSPDDWTKSTQALGILSKTPTHMFDKAGIDIPYIRRKLRMLSRKYPGQHIVAMVDYLQLIQGDASYKGNRTQEISAISRALKQIARELDLTIIALSQLSRKLEDRHDKRPMLSDLRESGQIEQDADVIGFIYRDDYYNADTDKPGVTEFIIAKQRNGAIGMVELVFRKEYSQFLNMSNQEKH